MLKNNKDKSLRIPIVKTIKIKFLPDNKNIQNPGKMLYFDAATYNNFIYSKVCNYNVCCC